MKCIALSVVLAVLLLGHDSSAAKVLGVFPFAGKSHWSFVSSVLKVLGEAGHEVSPLLFNLITIPFLTIFNSFQVTVISPFMLPNTTTATYTNIHLTEVTETFKKFAAQMDINHWTTKIPLMSLVNIAALGPIMVPAVMNDPGVKRLLADKTQHFDLVLVEPFATDSLYGFGGYFNAPVISVFTTAATRIVNSAVGNPEDPTYVPSLFMSYTDKMTLWQRVSNHLVAMLEYLVMEGIAMPKQAKLYKEYFPGNAKPLRQLVKEDVALAFINTHFSLSFPRPYVPNMIEVGGLNIDRELGELPEEFKSFLDSAEEGVVLFSMGSFLQASDFSKEQRAVIISALGKLKQKVIWRYNLPDAAELPKNILTKEWLPQKEILAHPNVKVFITHGGMLGTTESVYNGKPMIGIPCFGDQSMNIARAVKQGYAVKLDLGSLTEEGILGAVHEIIGNPKYSEKAQELSRIFRDQPMTPQESVLYWSEYVIRHKGAKHMQVEAQNLNFLAYHGLDVLAILFLAAVVFVILPNYFLAKWVLRKVCKSGKCGKRGNAKLKRN